MSIFSRLLSLHRGKGIDAVNLEVKSRTPEEDFFTEIVAHLIRTQPDLLLEWFNRDLFPHSREYGAISAVTQRWYSAPSGFERKSRVDLVVTMRRGERTDVIFIESKIRSKEGWGQLSRYGATLNELEGDGERWLVYVTRDFEPKPKEEEMRLGSVHFKQLRWHQFYRILKKHQEHPFVREVISFMEETNMSQGNRFTASDILTMQHLAKTTGLMRAALADEIERRFEALVGPAKWKDVYEDLSKFGRYVLFRWMPARWWCGLGFFPQTNLEEYPQVGLTLEIDPGAKDISLIINRMETWVTGNPIWQRDNLHLPHFWCGISIQRSMGDFLQHEDHVEAIKQFFAECLNELERFKTANPDLPWN